MTLWTIAPFVIMLAWLVGVGWWRDRGSWYRIQIRANHQYAVTYKASYEAPSIIREGVAQTDSDARYAAEQAILAHKKELADNQTIEDRLVKE